MNIFSRGKEQRLDDILRQKEARVSTIRHLLTKYPNTIICFKLNIPGPIKNNQYIFEIFTEGRQAILDRFSAAGSRCLYDKSKFSDAGDELYIVVAEDPVLVKKWMCEIEEQHFFGRLFDIDVISGDGTVSRTQIGYRERKCLLCDERAAICGRSRKHTVEELQEKISKIFEERILKHKNGC